MHCSCAAVPSGWRPLARLRFLVICRRSFCFRQATRQMKNGVALGAIPTSDLGLDLYKDAGGHNEAVESLNGAVIWFDDVDDALVSADLELLAALLVDER